MVLSVEGVLSGIIGVSKKSNFYQHKTPQRRHRQNELLNYYFFFWGGLAASLVVVFFKNCSSLKKEKEKEKERSGGHFFLCLDDVFLFFSFFFEIRNRFKKKRKMTFLRDARRFISIFISLKAGEEKKSKIIYCVG